MPQSDSDRPTILVVEDFDDTRQMLAIELRQQGYEVVEASDGLEAVEAAKRKCPDLVLMDLSLPVLDGLSATYRLRELESMCDVPIVACTAHSADIHLKAVREVGCDEYLSKPIDMAQLRGTVKRLLSERRRRGADATSHIVKKPMEQNELLSYIDSLLSK